MPFPKQVYCYRVARYANRVLLPNYNKTYEVSEWSINSKQFIKITCNCTTNCTYATICNTTGKPRQFGDCGCLQECGSCISYPIQYS